MSFFEDFVADGSHCASCCQFIGKPVGYTLFCKSCNPNVPRGTKKKRKVKKK